MAIGWGPSVLDLRRVVLPVPRLTKGGGEAVKLSRGVVLPQPVAHIMLPEEALHPGKGLCLLEVMQMGCCSREKCTKLRP
jgi:hypothetical protein